MDSYIENIGACLINTNQNLNLVLFNSMNLIVIIDDDFPWKSSVYTV